MTGWVVDIRATRHICSNNELFFNYEEVTNKENIYLGDSGTARVTRKGKVPLKLTSNKSLPLHHVLYVPKICRNLVFGFLNKAGVKLVFESNKIILSQNGDFLGKRFCHESLFVLDTDCENMNRYSTSSTYIVEFLVLWHGRLGHVNVVAIKRVKQIILIPNFTKHSKCEMCRSKTLQKPFQNC